MDGLWEAFCVIVWVDDGNGDGATTVLDEALLRMHRKLEDRFKLSKFYISL